MHYKIFMNVSWFDSSISFFIIRYYMIVINIRVFDHVTIRNQTVYQLFITFLNMADITSVL